MDKVRSLSAHDLSTGEMLFRLTSLVDPTLSCTTESEEVTDAVEGEDAEAVEGEDADAVEGEEVATEGEEVVAEDADVDAPVEGEATEATEEKTAE